MSSNAIGGDAFANLFGTSYPDDANAGSDEGFSLFDFATPLASDDRNETASGGFFSETSTLGFFDDTSGSSANGAPEFGNSFFDLPDASGSLFANGFPSRSISNEASPVQEEESPSTPEEPFRPKPEGSITQNDLDALKNDPVAQAQLKEDIATTPVLLYHGFSDQDDIRTDIPYLNRSGIDVNVENFEKDLSSILDRGGHLVTTRDIVEFRLYNGYDEPLPDNWHVIRIDDGDQTTALAVDVVKKLKEEENEDGTKKYEGQTIKLELGINAGTVGDPGTENATVSGDSETEKAGASGDLGTEKAGVYGTADDIESFVEKNPDYNEPDKDENGHVTYRKVTWDELAEWVDADLVEVSNHGLNHLVHANDTTGVDPVFLENGQRLSDGTVRKEIGTDDVVGSGEEKLERELSARLPENYEVTTFIWPRGDSDHPESEAAFHDSGHVVGLGTEQQNPDHRNISTGKFESPFNEGTQYSTIVEPIFELEDPEPSPWEIHSLPATTVATDGD